MYAGPSTCRLCLKVAELRDSHIYPDFFGRGGEEYYPTGESGDLQPFTQPVHTEPDRRFDRKQRGFWERRNGQIEKLLCHDCEQRFSGWEDYVKKFFYGRSHPIRFRQDLKIGSALFADYSKTKLFQMSLLWRVAIASGPFFAKVSLPQAHLDSLAESLRKGDPSSPDRYPCIMSLMTVSPAIAQLLQKSSAALETMSFEPVSHHLINGATVIFFLGGMAWLYWISDSPPPSMIGATYIQEDGRFFLDSLDVDHFFREFSDKAVASGNVTLADVEGNQEAKRRGAG